ncbi:MAG: glutamine amidotransferase [Patiriisocius sp.]|jgi:glutamine amidotransferase
MNIVIIDYGAGNIKSLQFAIERLGFKATLSNDETVIRHADKVIFPGVGEASSAMKKLKASGLDTVIPKLQQPVLGICLGMQLLCNSSKEGNTKGLGVFDVDVLRFSSEILKVPHIGWNTIKNLKGGLFTTIPEAAYMYLVHSYFVPVCKDTVATTSYGMDYSSALQKNNFYGVQFHPEKSSDIGAQLLKKFIEL